MWQTINKCHVNTFCGSLNRYFGWQLQKSYFREKRGGGSDQVFYLPKYTWCADNANLYYRTLPMATIQCTNFWNWLSISGEQGFLFHFGWLKHDIATGHLNKHFWVHWALILQFSCLFWLQLVGSILLHGLNVGIMFKTEISFLYPLIYDNVSTIYNANWKSVSQKLAKV